MPIYGQIQSFAVTNILVVIVRIYGGVKLGVGGLISAYRTAAQMTLESAEIIEKSINIHFLISFDYKNINKVMRVIKEKDAEILSQKMEMSCEIEICSRKKNAEILFNQFDTMFEVEIKRLK
jgi:putative IMPACT (imprinted ancient) family translation regulator